MIIQRSENRFDFRLRPNPIKPTDFSTTFIKLPAFVTRRKYFSIIQNSQANK